MSLLIGGPFDGRRVAMSLDTHGRYIRIPVIEPFDPFLAISSSAEAMRMKEEIYEEVGVHSRKHGRQSVYLHKSCDPEDVMAMLLSGYHAERPA